MLKYEEGKKDKFVYEDQRSIDLSQVAENEKSLLGYPESGIVSPEMT